MGDHSQDADDFLDGLNERRMFRELLTNRYYDARKSTGIGHHKLIRDDKVLAGRRVRYEANKLAAIGTTINCAFCNVEFVKKNVPQAFCSAKTKGKSQCRDRYHNCMTDARRRQDSDVRH